MTFFGLSSPEELDEPNKLAEISLDCSSFSAYVPEQFEEKHPVMQGRHENGSQKKGQDLAIDIKNMMMNSRRRRPPLSSEYCCIYRVSQVLREVNKKAYTPWTVSIGPLHHNNKNLKDMQEVKIEYLERFLERATKSDKLHELPSWADPEAFLNSKDTNTDDDDDEGNRFSCLDRFLSILESSQDRIRKSYAAHELNHITSQELLKIIMVDSAFIIELFLRLHFNKFESSPFVAVSVRMDLWLLENQLPFFILEELYNAAFASCPYPHIYPSFLDLSTEIFRGYNKQKLQIERKIVHFTDLQRTFLLPVREDGEKGGSSSSSSNKSMLKILSGFLRSSSNRKVGSYFERESCDVQLKSATQLHAAGVKLRVSSSKCLLDISFKIPKLEIPCLHLYDDTEALLRNVMALELYHYPDETLICDYVLLMDYLINTSEDVELLVEKKIITSRLGSNQQVASLFNRLARNIVKGFINQRFHCLVTELNQYCDTTWHTWKATLWSRYFSTPWKIASTIAAVILLLLTLIQTILTALG